MITACELTEFFIDGQPHPWLVAACEVFRRDCLATVGHDDFVSEPEVVASRLASPSSAMKVRNLIALVRRVVSS